MAAVTRHKIFMRILKLLIFMFFFILAVKQTWKGTSEKAQRATTYKSSVFKVYRTIACTGKKYPMLILIHDLCA